MKYTDCELFEVNETEWQVFIQSHTHTAKEHFEWCYERLNELIIKSTKENDWLEPEKNQLRNYRVKAMGFYLAKIWR
jgi:hypothetical protein